MSIQVKLYIEDRIVNILQFSFSLSQKTDYTGHPSSKPIGGLFKIVFETTKDKLFFLWMINNTMKNVKIVLSPSSMDGKSRTIELLDVYCLKHVDNFDGVNNQPMSTYIEISPAIMIDSGVKIFEKYWKETDLTNTAVATVINEEEPEESKIIDYYITDSVNNRIADNNKSKVGDIIFLNIHTQNLIGELLTINLDDKTIDFKYNGEVLINDTLVDYKIKSNKEKIELEVIEQNS